MYACDMHLHTLFSPDSRESMESYCERALALGLKTLCFTEHMDFDAPSLGYYTWEKYYDTLQRLRDKYDGRLELLAGLELSEPHDHQDALEEAQRRPYDFILGSVHYWIGGLFPSEMKTMNMDPRDCFALYWEQMQKMCACGGFDAVAHIDFPKRYFFELHYEEDVLNEIFSEIHKNSLCIELNSSSLRKGLDEPLPGKALLTMYREHGGRYVTLGADAHTAGDLCADIDTCEALAREAQLTPVKFVQRRMVTV